MLILIPYTYTHQLQLFRLLEK